MKNRQIALNRIITPDGTELISRHRHDYVSYTDENGSKYSVDGGCEYLRRGFDRHDYTEASLYEDDDFEVLRKHVCRGGRGKDGKQPLTFVPICEMSNDWLKATIKYNTDRGIEDSVNTKLYIKELEYRKENGIISFCKFK